MVGGCVLGWGGVVGGGGGGVGGEGGGGGGGEGTCNRTKHSLYVYKLRKVCRVPSYSLGANHQRNRLWLLGRVKLKLFPKLFYFLSKY